MNLFDFSLKFNGYPLIEAQKTLKAIQSIEEPEYENYVSSKKMEILEFHLKHNSYYQSLFDSQITSWESVPVLTKKDLQIPLKNRLSNGYKLKNVYINKTSGSTGTPFYFAKDKFSVSSLNLMGCIMNGFRMQSLMQWQEIH